MNRMKTILIILNSLILMTGCFAGTAGEIEPGDVMRVEVFKTPFNTAPANDAEPAPDTPFLYYGYLVEVQNVDGDWVYVRTVDKLITGYQNYSPYNLEGWVRYKDGNNRILEEIPDDWTATHPTLREFLDEAPPYTRPLAGGIPNFIMAVGYGVDFAGRAGNWDAWYYFGDDPSTYIRTTFDGGDISASLSSNPPDQQDNLGWMPPYGGNSRLAPAFVDSDCIGDPPNVERCLAEPGVDVAAFENVMLGRTDNSTGASLGVRGSRYNLTLEGSSSDFVALFDSSAGDFFGVK